LLGSCVRAAKRLGASKLVRECGLRVVIENSSSIVVAGLPVGRIDTAATWSTASAVQSVVDRVGRRALLRGNDMKVMAVVTRYGC
jgi:hypothetical protein